MNQKNMKLKNISVITPTTFYSKANAFIYQEGKREHYKGTSSNTNCNNRITFKSSSLFHQKNNYQSSSSTKRNKELKPHSHSKLGRFSREDSIIYINYTHSQSIDEICFKFFQYAQLKISIQ